MADDIFSLSPNNIGRVGLTYFDTNMKECIRKELEKS